MKQALFRNSMTTAKPVLAIAVPGSDPFLDADGYVSFVLGVLGVGGFGARGLGACVGGV